MKIVERKNIRTLSWEEKDNLVRAFAGIQKLDPTDPNSFFMIAGYHGEPFRGAGWGNPQWWGGYCNHGNVLFPTWHRAYLHRLEKALQTIVPGVAMAYWDETEVESREKGIPDIFLMPEWECKNKEVIKPNPLYSYKFQANITDRLSPIPDANYSKAAGYETVRYPFSGLVGTDEDKANTEVHNEELRKMGVAHTNGMLNLNVVKWLNKVTFQNHEGQDVDANIAHKYGACLNAPNYTIFSNTTSATQWNDERVGTKDYVRVVPLESPHNSMHLAVGGFEVQKTNSDYNDYAGANGDMGENDTAAFDPIFFFHHCFVDLVFYEWQKKWNALESLEIIPGYPGTNSVDNQGPTPGVAGGTWLSLDSALDPFKKPGSQTEPMTSRDVVNPLSLGYTYVYDSHTPNRLNDGNSDLYIPHEQEAVPVIEVSNVNRASIGGSFLINVYDQTTGTLVGTEAVLSRWHVSGCANCQNHLDVRTHIPLHGYSKADAEKGSFEVLLQSRNPVDANRLNMGHVADPAKKQNPKFRVITSHMD
ncbi:putative tyrosinase [Fusarium flagelliforme]|uniref:tyrosinase n=1 Tax=Fusarium flagelliforme TaxID=2675880 RepID=A0A395N4C0_9HYPO|nr:putative tyrosinase [Fusarium flagelliforme]KAH7193969.1 putative tyrosinase [Fusarium flagelliforme]RFN54439.1 tyrosinase [Fusarium flagelliforme]